MIYGLLTALVGVVYLILIGGLGGLLNQMAGIQNDWLIIASTLLISVAFVPVRNRLQRFVDRRFSRGKTDYALALQNLSADIADLQSEDTASQRLVERLQESLQNRWVVLFLRAASESRFRVEGKVGLKDDLLGRVAGGELPALRQLQAVGVVSPVNVTEFGA